MAPCFRKARSRRPLCASLEIQADGCRDCESFYQRVWMMFILNLESIVILVYLQIRTLRTHRILKSCHSFYWLEPCSGNLLRSYDARSADSLARKHQHRHDESLACSFTLLRSAPQLTAAKQEKYWNCWLIGFYLDCRTLPWPCRSRCFAWHRTSCSLEQIV